MRGGGATAQLNGGISVESRSESLSLYSVDAPQIKLADTMHALG